MLRLALVVMPGIISWAVALNDGGKVNIDPEPASTPGRLSECAAVTPPASGEGHARWTGRRLVQVE